MENTKIYFAPLEGITIYSYRNLHHKYFSGGISAYYTPFLAIQKHHAFKKRDIREILPQNNPGMEDLIIPQIIAGKAEDILWGVNELKDRGFKKINLNVGCPVATVVSKNKGSGMLKDVHELDNVLSDVFGSKTMDDVEFSVKTRIGIEDPEEFYKILPVYNKFPLSKLIIHPRVRKQMYQGKPHMDIFKWACENSKNKLCYNGDICSVEDYEKFRKDYPEVSEIMIGRGLIANPALAREINGGERLKSEEIKGFMEEMFENYHNEIPGDIQIMHKMKELWVYVGKNFVDKSGETADAYIHKICVSKSLPEYRNAVRTLYKECDIR